MCARRCHFTRLACACSDEQAPLAGAPARRSSSARQRAPQQQQLCRYLARRGGGMVSLMGHACSESGGAWQAAAYLFARYWAGGKRSAVTGALPCTSAARRHRTRAHGARACRTAGYGAARLSSICCWRRRAAARARGRPRARAPALKSGKQRPVSINP